MPATQFPIIGITGFARSGKDTCADFILQHQQGYPYGFADPIKQMLIPLGIDMTDPFWVENKEANIPRLGRSVRYLLQTLGTEWGRELVHPDLWVLLAKSILEQHGPGMVVSDVRFENEAEFIRAAGGKILLVQRPVRDVVRPHLSEKGVAILPGDFVVSNDGTIEQLYTKLAHMFDGQ